MRSFVAIRAPELLDLPDLPEPPDRAPRHCTLRFLGDIDEPTAQGVSSVLAEVAARTRPFELSLSGIGAFPDWKRPRVVFVRVVTGREELVALAEAVGAGLERLGLPREPRPFLPHVTVLRVRSARDEARGRRIAEEARDRVLATGPVEELLRMESRLLPTGAEHHPAGRFRLTSPA